MKPKSASSTTLKVKSHGKPFWKENVRNRGKPFWKENVRSIVYFLLILLLYSTILSVTPRICIYMIDGFSFICWSSVKFVRLKNSHTLKFRKVSLKFRKVLSEKFEMSTFNSIWIFEFKGGFSYLGSTTIYIYRKF